MKVLVVVDMQNDFIDGSLGTKEAEGIVQNVVDKINQFDGKIAVTFDTHGENYFDTQEGKALPVVHCVGKTNGWMLEHRIEYALGKKGNYGTHIEVFQKQTFGSTRLGDWLYQQSLSEDIEEIILVGLCTDICVISNALLIKAFLPEVKITVDASCCAGVTPESHNNALAAMKICQINIENWEV